MRRGLRGLLILYAVKELSLVQTLAYRSVSLTGPFAIRGLSLARSRTTTSPEWWRSSCGTGGAMLQLENGETTIFWASSQARDRPTLVGFTSCNPDSRTVNWLRSIGPLAGLLVPCTIDQPLMWSLRLHATWVLFIKRRLLILCHQHTAHWSGKAPYPPLWRL